MVLNLTTLILFILCTFSSIALGQDEENKAGIDKCSSPPPRFRNMSSCCELPNLIEESVLEECGIPLDLGARFWLHGPRGQHHHRHGPGRFHQHGTHGGHGWPGCGHHRNHGPEGGPHGHGWMEHGPHGGPGSEHDGPEGEPHGHGPPDQQDNERPPPGADLKPSVADGAPTTMSTFEEEWNLDGVESSVDDDVVKPDFQPFRRARRHPAPHRHGHRRHHGPPPCDKELCIFRKLNLLGEDEKVDTEAFAALLDQLATRDVAWSGVKDAVDKDCITNNEHINRPFGICEPVHLLVCTTGHLFKNCPEGKWRADDNCSALKTFMNDCYGP